MSLAVFKPLQGDSIVIFQHENPVLQMTLAEAWKLAQKLEEVRRAIPGTTIPVIP